LNPRPADYESGARMERQGKANKERRAGKRATCPPFSAFRHDGATHHASHTRSFCLDDTAQEVYRCAIRLDGPLPSMESTTQAAKRKRPSSSSQAGHNHALLWLLSLHPIVSALGPRRHYVRATIHPARRACIQFPRRADKPSSPGDVVAVPVVSSLVS